MNDRKRKQPKRRREPRREERIKAIILVTGSALDGWVLWQPPGAPPIVLPAAATPAGFVPNLGVNCGNAPASAPPYLACEAAYKAAPFVAAGWRYHSGGQISSLASLQAQLTVVAAWNPAAFRVIVCDEVEAPWFGPFTVPRVVNEGQFTSNWATAVGPTCFSPDDAPANGRPAAFAAVNAAMARVVAAAAGGPQVASCKPAP